LFLTYANNEHLSRVVLRNNGVVRLYHRIISQSGRKQTPGPHFCSILYSPLRKGGLSGSFGRQRPDLLTAELRRACRSGGQIAMANWTPSGFIGAVLAPFRQAENEWLLFFVPRVVRFAN
jgi:hypothetical protein